MTMKKLLRSTLAFLCAASLVLGSFGGHLGTVLAEEDSPTPPELEEVTFSDFGIDDNTYQSTVKNKQVVNGEYEGGIKNRTFVGKMNFSSQNRIGIVFGGVEPGAMGFILGTWTTGTLACWTSKQSVTGSITYGGKKLSGDDVPLGQEKTVKISFEVMNNDEEEVDNDIRIWLYFDGVLYKGTYLCVLEDYADYLNDKIGIYAWNTTGTVSVASVEPTLDSLTEDFTKVTPRDFGLLYKTYTGVSEDGSSKTPVLESNMNKVRFDTKISMSGSGTKTFIYTKSNNNTSAGLKFLLQGSYPNRIWLQNAISGSDGKVWTEGATSGSSACYLQIANTGIEGATTFLDLTYQLTITTEYVDADEGTEAGGTPNDIKLGIWFDGNLYNEQYFYIKDCVDVVAANVRLARTGTTGSITLENLTPLDPVVTNETYNLSDGDYLVTGTGTITVNGQEMENGSRLTEPGEYQIISDNGRITRNVTLIETGSKSTAITYENGVMPIAGYNGPYIGTDGRGTTHNTITDEVYQLLDEAGFNLINKINIDWNVPENQTDIIQSLEYAEKHGIGLYVWDSSIKSGNLTDTAIAEQISQYSQYESFKGIYVIDEPGTASHYPGNPQLSSYAGRAQAINQYCNLNAYINLLPKSDSTEEVYSAYIDEYLTSTGGRYISFDYYPFGTTYNQNWNMFLSSGSVPNYFKHLSIVRGKALTNGIPFWTFIQAGTNWNKSPGYNLPSTNNSSPTREQLLWNVNTSLAYGAKGIQYFPMVQPASFAFTVGNTYDYERNGVLGANGEPTPWYPFVKEANEQIALVDEYLLAATSTAVLAKGTGAQQDTEITNEAYGLLETIGVSDTKNGAVVGAFDYNGSDMFYVVNYDTTGTTTSDTITLNFTKETEYRVIQDGVTTSGEGSTCALTIPAGEAVLVIIDSEEIVDEPEDDMTRLTPADFGFEYKTYLGKGAEGETTGETKGYYEELTSMDRVMFKTRITMNGTNTYISYMSKDNTNYSPGLKLRVASDGSLNIEQNLTTDATISRVGNAVSEKTSFKIATSAVGANTWKGQTFDLAITTEFVDYDGTGGENDLKLGFYINDVFYAYDYYIKNCKDACYPYLYLYRPGADRTITLEDPVVFETELQPEITDSIAMTYRTVLTNNVTEAPTMTFARGGQEMTVTGLRKNEKIWEFTYPNVYPQNMAETVTATLQVGDYEKAYSTSMLDYSAYVLGLEAGTTYTEEQLDKLKNLIVDLVQYGAGAQRYKGVADDSEALLTNKLEILVPGYETSFDLEDETSFDNLTTAGERLTGTSTDSAYTWKSATLVLGNKVKIRYKFEAENVDKLTVKATINNKLYELEPEQTEDGKWFVDFDSIYAYEYDQTVSVSFYEAGQQVGKTVNYSVNTYLNAMQGYVEVDESLWSNLLFTIHNYGTAAKAYQDVR